LPGPPVPREIGCTCNDALPTSWPHPTCPTPATARRKQFNGRLKHLRGSALGFRNLTNYTPAACSRQEKSDLKYTLDCDEPVWII